MPPGGRGRGPEEGLSHGGGAEGFPPFPGEGRGHMPGPPSLARRAPRGTLPQSGGPGVSPRQRTSGADACRPACTEEERTGGKCPGGEPSGRGATGSARRGAPVCRVVGIEEEAGRVCAPAPGACVRPRKAERGSGKVTLEPDFSHQEKCPSGPHALPSRALQSLRGCSRIQGRAAPAGGVRAKLVLPW